MDADQVESKANSYTLGWMLTKYEIKIPLIPLTL